MAKPKINPWCYRQALQRACHTQANLKRSESASLQQGILISYGTLEGNRGLRLTLLKPCDEPPTVSDCSYHSYTMSDFLVQSRVQVSRASALCTASSSYRPIAVTAVHFSYWICYMLLSYECGWA